MFTISAVRDGKHLSEENNSPWKSLDNLALAYANHDMHIKKAIKIEEERKKKIRKSQDSETAFPSNLLGAWGEQKGKN